MNFDDPCTASLPAVLRLIDDGQEETYKVDFKRKSDPHEEGLSRDDKKALGEAASGFANADGGMLIVGIETECINGIDRAKRIAPIENVQAVADRYRAYLIECVSPTVTNTQVQLICTDGENSGILVIHIPKGQQRPHMSTAPGHHRFYRRVEDRFLQMERYEIDEMFRLKSSPKLGLILEYDSGGRIGGNSKSFIRFGLENRSSVTAKFPFISVSRNLDAPRLAEYGLDGNGGTLFSRLPTGHRGDILFSGGSDIVIHPEQALFVSRLEYLHSVDERMGKYWAATSLHPRGICTIEFTIGCEDAPMERFSVDFSCSNLLNHESPLISVK